MYYHEQSAKYAKELVDKLPKRPDGEDWVRAYVSLAVDFFHFISSVFLQVVHLVNSGSEAVDLAIQMARQYTGRSEMVALHKAYHGLQGYAAGVTAIGKVGCDDTIILPISRFFFFLMRVFVWSR